MRYNTHLACALVIAVPILHVTNHLDVASITALSLGTLMPDIDEPQSFIGRRTAAGVSHLMNIIFGHRGMTHTICATTLVFFIGILISKWGLLPYYSTTAFTLGYFLHILADSFSKSGVPWLLPFSKKKYKSGFGVMYYTTGSIVEHLIFICMVGLLGVMVYMLKIEMNLDLHQVIRNVTLTLR